MTDDEKLIEVMAIGAAEARLGKGCWTRAHDSERDIWRQEAEGGLSALRAAGWLLIPPLDSDEGREAVERAWKAQCAGGGGWRDGVMDALRAAGGSHE